MSAPTEPRSALQVDARRLRRHLQRLHHVGDRAIDVDREVLERNRLRDVPQVLEHALDDQALALDHPLERVAILGIVEHPHDELRVGDDRLDGVREVVHEAGGDLAEHGLSLLAPDVLLELDQAVGHGVEGVAELANLVLPGDGHALVHAALCERLGGPGEGEDAGDEGTAPEPAQDDRAEQGEADGDEQLSLEPAWPSANASVVGCSTMTTQDRRGTTAPGGEHLAPALVLVRVRQTPCAAHAAATGARQTPAIVSSVCPACALKATCRLPVGIAVRDEAFVRHEQREALAAHADAIDGLPDVFEPYLRHHPARFLAGRPDLYRDGLVRGRPSSPICRGAM